MKNLKNQKTLQHLNGACTRLLDDSPNHPVYLLLRAFSRFTIEDYDKNDASIDMEKAWLFLKTITIGKGVNTYQILVGFII